MSKTWQGRIGSASDPRFERFNSSIDQDKRLAPYDIRASQAHALALAGAGVISAAEADQLVAALEEIGGEIARGEMEWRDELEDVHTHVESRLRDRVGGLADRLHTGRSRNDQIAADVRLYAKDRMADAMRSIVDLQTSLLELARRYDRDVMPGYTHLQQAQPLLIAHPLLAYAWMLGRDFERLDGCRRRTDRSPLGCGALAGATFDLDRGLLARACGFADVLPNSLDAVADRDFVAEFAAAAALCMTHLSRFAEDLIIWSSTEMGYVILPDAFASGSSMMPQKKNPDIPELIRGRTALVIGDATAALTLLKGLPLAYNKDLQDDKTPLYHAADTLVDALQMLAAMVPHLRFNTDRARANISSFALATDIADHLVRKGVPFRAAHAVVGQLVERCVTDGRELSDLGPDELREASPHLTDLPDLRPDASVALKRTTGSTSPDSVSAQFDALAALIAQSRAVIEGLS